MQRDYGSFGVEPLTPHIGAEVQGLDLREPLEGARAAGLRRAFLDWSVLVFRDQKLSPEQHKAFGRLFGPLHVHPLKAAAGYDESGDPEILKVKTTAESRYTAGDGWHTDVSCDERPPLGSMLYMKEIPAAGCGGDTLFADMYRAYELLSPPLQRLLEGLRAVHDGGLPYSSGYGYAPPAGKTFPKHEHPVITRHPETGRKVLFVNSGFTTRIVGLRPRESRRLLDLLFEHVADTPALTCRVRWAPGTLTFWDNRCTQHHAVWDYFPESRYGERVSIVGERPAA